MKQIALTVALALVFGLAALAQTQSNEPQGSSSPSSSQTTPSTSPSTAPPSAPEMGTQPSASGKQTAGAEGKEAKGEKKLKGCIESQGGQYVLKEKSGKEISLTGSADFASHVGHTVAVHGTMEKGAASSMGASGTEKSSAGTMGSSASSGEQFSVSKIDHISDTCKLEKGSKSGKSDMGTSSTNPSSKPDHQ
jgi:hypothetical protein